MILKKEELRPDELVVEETLFHVANGYFGVRGCFEEGYPPEVASIRGCYINGFYDTVTLNYPEKLYGFAERVQRMVNLPDIQSIQLWLNGEAFSPFEGELLQYERTLDTQTGIATRRMEWKGKRANGRVAITICRMASFARPELYLTTYKVESLDFEGEVRFGSAVSSAVSNYADPSDPRVAAEGQQHICLESVEITAEDALLRCRTAASGLDMAVCQRMELQGAGSAVYHKTGVGFVANAISKLVPGASLTVEVYTLLSDSRRQKHPGAHARHMAQSCSAAGAKLLFAEQEAYLEKFWAVAGAGIAGDERASEGIAFNLFQLLQSTGKDSVGNISAKGLSGEGYEGHYFWDTEIYLFPFFLHTQPHIARCLLEYRYGILNGARRHARIMGHRRGALYPWRTIAGSECSAYYPSGSAQYHITGDVAHSFLQYWHATGDLDFMADKGAEVLLETARLWLDVGHYDREGRFCIQDVTGPDEYTCIVNNNYYTNQIARHNLLGAVEVYKALQQAGMHQKTEARIRFDPRELEEFSGAARGMFLPYDEKLDIHAQDDSFLNKPVWDIAATAPENFPLLLHYHPLYLYRHQVCKQADTVLAHYLFEEGIAESTLRNSYLYYEAVTTHDSSLSSCVYSIMAARLGMKEKAYRYYNTTIYADLDNAHKNTKDGLHTANLGGTWLGLVSGFAGLRLRPDGLHFRFMLPQQWKAYTFHIFHRGSLLYFTVEKDAVTVQLQQGDGVSIYVDGVPYAIEGTTRLEGLVQ